MHVAPELAAELDDWHRERGQSWVCARRLALDPDELVGVPMAAELCGVGERTIDNWGTEGLASVHTPEGVRYKVGDLLEHQAEKRRRRLHAAG